MKRFLALALAGFILWPRFQRLLRQDHAGQAKARAGEA
jgi:hypothetical protein